MAFFTSRLCEKFHKVDRNHGVDHPAADRVREGAHLQRQSLPEKYLALSDQEMDARIAAARRSLGSRLVILGHHYQRDEVIKFADYTGDSFRLARQVAMRPEADYIVFCGVHFMAEAPSPGRPASAGDPA